MATRDALSRFVHDALAAGRTRDEVRSQLSAAGWSEREVADALRSFAVTAFVPPVPRPVPHVTARDVFLYALLFTALTLTASYLIVLVNGIIDTFLPDPADNRTYSVNRPRERIRWAISMLAVSGPLYVWLTLHTGRRLASDAGEQRSLVRRWLTYLALFVAAIIFLGDISYVIYHFLSGEMALRFLLKALTVATVTAGVFAFYSGSLREAEVDA